MGLHARWRVTRGRGGSGEKVGVSEKEGEKKKGITERLTE